MDLIKVCSFCTNSFDLLDNSPRILPCGNLICLKCACQSPRNLGELSINCKYCSKEHFIEDLNNDLPISQLVIDCLDSNQDTNLEKMKESAENFRYTFEKDKYQMSNHYDAMEILIHLKAETLIKTIHDTHDKLLDELKSYREITDKQVELFSYQKESQFKSLIDKISPLKFNDEDNLQKYIQNYNTLQNSIKDLKNNCYYFKPTAIDKTIFGFCYNNNSQKIYKKVESLNALIDNKDTFNELAFKSTLKKASLRRYILPLNRDRVLCIYFSTNHSLHLEVYNSNNDLIKSMQLPHLIEYYPIFHGIGNSFVLIYSKSNKSKFDRSVTIISVFDCDLNEICKTEENSSIGNVYATNENIVCLFYNRSSNFIKVYDSNLKSKDTFGQCDDHKQAFYVNRHLMDPSRIVSEAIYPIIFGYKDNKIYMHDEKSVYVMCRKTGHYLNTFLKTDQDSSFILDSFNNIIEFNSVTRNIRVLDENLHLNVYFKRKFDQLYLLDDKYLAFVDKQKDCVIII